MALTQSQLLEIQESRTHTSKTCRTSSPELEKILYSPFTVLDHGFVRVVDYMGSDESIVQAARVSYGIGTQKKSNDRGLIRYLMRHRHTTPFEMCEIKFHVKLPIFVARQWIRHRTANVNEYSARYSILDKEFYVPVPDNLASQSKTNRQGRSAVLTGTEAENTLKEIENFSEDAYQKYLAFLNEDGYGNTYDEKRQGLARELARMILPVNFYTQWYWKIDLHNLLHFLSLRADSHAQYEIRAYADVMLHTIVKCWVPYAYEAFMDYCVKGVSLSAQEYELLKERLSGKDMDQAKSGLSGREWQELKNKFDIEK